MSSAPALLVIAGATATGKTRLAISVALALRAEGARAEVISADSRQVFRGLDIATAKATTAERHSVPHHGLDLVEPDEAFSVADFVDHVAAVLSGLAAVGGLAILVGGTGLYLRAIARGIDTDALPSDPAVRARLEAELLSGGLDPLVERLRATAPERVTRIDLHNPRRVVRALEIATLDGGKGPLPEPRGYGGPVRWIGLSMDVAMHQSWIERRSRNQFDSGLIEEARALRERYDPALPAFSAIGYREAWAVLDGRMTTEAAVAANAQRTVAFSKRQRTWFRSEPEIVWLDDGEPTGDRRALEPALATAHRLLDADAERR